MPVRAFSWNSKLDHLQSIKGLQVGIIHSRACTTGRKFILDCHLQTNIVNHEIQIYKFKLQFFIVSMVCYQEVRWGLLIQCLFPMKPAFAEILYYEKYASNGFGVTW